MSIAANVRYFARSITYPFIDRYRRKPALAQARRIFGPRVYLSHYFVGGAGNEAEVFELGVWRRVLFIPVRQCVFRYSPAGDQKIMPAGEDPWGYVIAMAQIIQ